MSVKKILMGATKWALFKKDAGTYNFGAIVGTMILLK